MSVFAIVVMVIVSSLAASAGWMVSRVTLRANAASPDAARPKQSTSRSGEVAAAHSHTSPEPGLRYIAMIELGSLDQLRSEQGDIAIDALLEQLAAVAEPHLPGFRLERLGSNSFDITFAARDQASAMTSLRAALEAIENFSAEPRRYCARAAYLHLGDGPITQAMLDLAADTLISRALDDDPVLLARPAAEMIGMGRETETIRRLREAIQANATALHYQPKLDMRSATYPSVEALFRWDGIHNAQTTIGELIHSAERRGVIRELTLWSLKRAIHDQLTMIEHGLDLTTYVNLSGKLLSDSEFTLQAVEIIKSAPGKIGLEITETAVIERPDRAIASLEMYHAAGAPIAIDDYGTGLSSLRYLKRIPAEELKIDREFIAELTSSHRDPMIVRSTIDLAHALGLRVTAEGVDDPIKLALLKVMGCDFAQGYHIARPMPLDRLIDFMGDQELHDSIANPELSLLSGLAIGGPRPGQALDNWLPAR